MDCFQSRSSLPPQQSTTSEHPEGDASDSDPLQQWLLFDPPPPAQENDSSLAADSFHSISHPSPVHTSMPAHDGTGHFFTPGPALSPAASEYDFNPITAQSLLSLSDFDLENDELLSIPSSLSISHSASSRSSQNRRTHQAMSPEESELLLNPMAISAGLSHHTSVISSQHLSSSKCSHQSIDRQARQSTTGGSHSRRTHSHSSRRSRIRPIHNANTTNTSSNRRRRSSSARNNPPPIVIIPSDSKINLFPANRQAARHFLTSVASRLLDLDSDTMNMLSNPQHDPQPIQTQHYHNLPSSTGHTLKRRVPPRFSIGDDAQRSLSSQEQGMISSPMDLSGFMPPSCTSAWRTTEEPHEEEEEEEGADEQGVVEKDEDGHEQERGPGACLSRRAQYGTTTLRIHASRSSDHLHLSPIHPARRDPRHLPRRSSSAQHDLNLLSAQQHLPLPSPDTESPSTDSMATVLLKKVFDEWTTW
ncbi:hypothetical protein PCANC_27416 [Puccinia coronata f. sp. avenae]|uniref:Uncharacterized protein n=1 Tax=Puccinia coronata f. sp. avenae TaxID=200324 RepID=A0A2N5TBC3_9BASI|nr:hypothetical protein PCASD_23265 [Puccinia coronata f. sp. avenae]PLW22823.1 hypothetical protein PCANC_27416 [Puccinia coronata f. sp. avenae]